MADYSEAYKKYFKDKLGMSIDELDKIFSSSSKLASPETQMINTAAANATKEKMFSSAAKLASPETQAVNSTASGRSKTMLEMLDAMTPEARKATINKPYVVANIEKAMAASDKFNRNLLPSNIIKDATMETPYGKSFLSYTPEGKVAGKAGAMLRGLSKVAGPIGAALTAYDLGAALSEVQDKGAAKIAEDYKNSQVADAAPKNMELRGEEESPKAGVIMTPEVVKALEEKRQKLIETRRDLEKQRRMDEYDQRARARQMRVQDTLEKTGLAGY